MFYRRTVCFVTGSSRGLGESIASNLACKCPEGSVIALLARSQGDLETVRKRLQEKSPHVTAIAHHFDQSEQDTQHFAAVFSQVFKVLGARAEDFQQAILVHNAATIEPVKFIRNLPPVTDVTHYLKTNMSGVIALTTEFLKFFPATLPDFSRVVVNISSLSALQPVKSWAMYSSVKSAREMFFKVLAAEEDGIRVLNYAPGPLMTDMTETVLHTCEDDETCRWLTDVKAENKLLTCDTSAGKLMEIMEKDAFQNGAHVDYEDEI